MLRTSVLITTPLKYWTDWQRDVRRRLYFRQSCRIWLQRLKCSSLAARFTFFPPAGSCINMSRHTFKSVVRREGRINEKEQLFCSSSYVEESSSLTATSLNRSPAFGVRRGEALLWTGGRWRYFVSELFNFTAGSWINLKLGSQICWDSDEHKQRPRAKTKPQAKLKIISHKGSKSISRQKWEITSNLADVPAA